MRYTFLFIGATLLLSLQAVAQLSIGTQGMTILATTSLSVDGLSITPSTSLTLVNNTLQKNTTPASTTPQASISRVYQFSVAIPFSGTVSFPYLTAELNGNVEKRLKLLYAITSGGTYVNSPPSTRNSTTKVISTTFVSQNLLALTAASQNPDLSPTLVLPEANFPAGSSRNFVVNIVEAVGLSTSIGNVLITLTAPVGYTLSFDNSLISIDVSGGSTTMLNNAQWSATSNSGNQQLTLQINAGESVGASATSSLGFTITRTSANTGSASNVTVNVADDASKTYDGNTANNVYSRVISGL